MFLPLFLVKHLVYTLVCAIFAQICEISGFMNKFIKSRINQLKAHPRWVRNPVGFLLIFGGVLGALPILGFWMIPLGLVILSVDYRWVSLGETCSDPPQTCLAPDQKSVPAAFWRQAGIIAGQG